MKTDPFTELYNSVDWSKVASPTPLSERYIEDSKWVGTHRKELTKYEGMWIAVYQKKVIAYSPTGEDTQQKAFQVLGKEIPDLYLRFLEDATVIY